MKMMTRFCETMLAGMLMFRISSSLMLGAGLLAKNEQARSRVEAMITRLKSLESNAT